jgi:UDP-glucose 4-epimerase
LKNLILGGAGFIGSHLNNALAARSQICISIDSLSMGNTLERAGLACELIVDDISSSANLANLLKSFRPDRIYHFAANSDILASSLNAELDIKNTFLTTQNLVNAIREADLKPQIIFASSSAVYGELVGKIGESSQKHPRSPYGWTKLLSETILKDALNLQTIGKLIIVRFPNVTGAWQTHGVVKDLVRKLKMNHEFLEVLGDGNQQKPYVLANELCEAIILLAESHKESLLEVNLAPSDEITVKQIVKELLNLSQLNPKLNYGTTPYGWEGDIAKYSYDTSLARKLLGDFSFSSSKTAIRQSLEWEWQHYGV